jgi:glycosyltransferase involved in cell wall biosynthesis
LTIASIPVSTASAERPLHVLYLGHTARMSGAEIGTLRLIEAAERVQATVLLAENGPLAGALRDAGARVEVVPLAERARGVPRAQVRLGVSQVAGAVEVAKYVRELRARIRELRPDLVHTISLKAAVYGSSAARLAGTPCICHLHDRLAPDYLPARILPPLRLMFSTLPDALVVPSRSTLATVGRRRRPGLRAAVIPLPVPMPAEPVPVADEVRVVGMVGRLTPWKGQHVFLEAFARAFPHGAVRARVIGSALFGEEGYARELRAQAERLGIAGRVDFVGFTDDVAGELRRLDVLVHCSVLPDPLATTVLEGMAAGLPVISANAGGTAEHIEPEIEGLLHEPGDVAMLAEALVRVAGDRELRARIAAGGRRKAREFTPEAVVEQMVDLYRELARPGGG